MKIVYLILSTVNSGGMERVLSNKVNYLADKLGYDVSIITTDQKERPSFFYFSDKILHFDLGINYTDNAGRSFLVKTISYLLKHRAHRIRLTKLLNQMDADIVVSMFGADVDFLYKIRDKSHKVAEIHMSKAFRIKMDRGGLFGLSDRWRAMRDIKLPAKYDKFVVLASEDKKLWGNLPNSVIIPNPLPWIARGNSSLESKRVISIGRLSYDKGYDILINAWKQVNQIHSDWQLTIIGNGSEKDQYQVQIAESNLADSINLLPALSDVESQYLESSIYVLSSRHESFGMALIEAMSCGLPCVSFDCSGPKDIITNGANGLLITQGDVNGLAAGICKLIENDDLRTRMGKEASRMVRENFNEDKIMAQWIELFNTLIK